MLKNYGIFTEDNHFVMENGENQHTFISHSEISQSKTKYGTVRQCQTNLINLLFDSVSLFVIMFHTERLCLIQSIVFLCLKNSKRSCPCIPFSICFTNIIMLEYSFLCFSEKKFHFKFIYSGLTYHGKISVLVSCLFNVCLQALNHSHMKPSNCNNFQPELSFFILFVLYIFVFSWKLAVRKEYVHSCEAQKNKGMSKHVSQTLE